MNYHKKKMLLNHLLIILQELQQDKSLQTIIIDQYYEHLLGTLSKEKQTLTRNLIHYLTLLNKNYREQENGDYLSTEEDIFISLELVQDILKPKSILCLKEQSLLEQIEQKYLGEIFNRNQVQNLLNLSKSHTHRLIIKLENLNLIQREQNHKNQGYMYSFGIPNIEIQELFSDNENIEFSDIR